MYNALIIVSRFISKASAVPIIRVRSPRSSMTQRPSLFTLISYCAIVFSFALMFANGWFTACDGFYDASAYWLSHTKQ